MIHARTDYDRIQDPGLDDPSLLSPGSTPIGADEPVFLIRGKDAAAVSTILHWVDESLKLGVDVELCHHVTAWAAVVALWQSKHGRKAADSPEECIRPL